MKDMSEEVTSAKKLFQFKISGINFEISTEGTLKELTDARGGVSYSIITSVNFLAPLLFSLSITDYLSSRHSLENYASTTILHQLTV